VRQGQADAHEGSGSTLCGEARGEACQRLSRVMQVPGQTLARWPARSSSHSSSPRGQAHSHTSDSSTTTGRLCSARHGTCMHAAEAV
jgi:hypothetical protein